MSFADATAVTSAGDAVLDRGDDRGPDLHADLHADWRIGDALNGGYLLAVVGRALGRVAPGKPDPVAVSAYYASAAVPGPATIRTRVVREGGSSAVLAADLVQGEAVRLSALATYGVLGPGGGPDDVRTTATPPDLPPPEECVGVAEVAPGFARTAPFVSSFELRTDPASAGWLSGEPSGRGVQQGWFRLHPDASGPVDADPWVLLMVLDCLPPVTFDLGLPGWAPTLELTAHVRARPAPGWLAVRHATRNVADGLFEEDCEIWDSAGRLVAQGRQLARLPRPVPTTRG